MPTPSSFSTNPGYYVEALRTLYPEQFAGREIVLRPVSEGIQNYNFTVNDTHFFSIMRFGQGENPDPAHQQQLLDVQAALVAKGLPAPQPIAGTNGQLLQKMPDGPAGLSGSLCCLTTFVPGQSVRKDAASLDDFRTMGELHGHYLAKGKAIEDTRFPLPENPVSLPKLYALFQSTMAQAGGVAKAIETLQAKLSTEPLGAHKVVREFVVALQDGWYEKTEEAYRAALTKWQEKGYDNLPQSLLHGDVHLGNVFTQGQHAIYDMGWMGKGTRLFDICQPIVLNCVNDDGSINRLKMDAYLTGLAKHITLTPEETAALPDMIAIVHLRSTPTRLASMLHSSELSHITKSPVELTNRMEAYNARLHMLDTYTNTSRAPALSRPQCR